MNVNVNTSVVKALMCLRQLSDAQLASLSSVTQGDLHAWLYDIGEASEERVPFDTQLEIVRLLGVSGDAPRHDVVHYWKLHQPLFSRSADVYWPLAVMLKAFGKAQAVYLARESDPAFTFQAKSCFGLRFDTFTAILEVTSHPLRSIALNPETMPDLAWVPDTFGVVLPDAEYDALEPGAMKPRGLQQYLTYTSEAAQWNRLRDAALEKGLRAEEVATLLLGGPIVTALPSATVDEAVRSEASEVACVAATPAVDDDMDLFTPVRSVN